MYANANNLGSMMLRGRFAEAPPPEWIAADQKSNVQGSSSPDGPYTIDRPDNVSEGDLLVFVHSCFHEGGKIQGGVVPAGFTLVAEGGNLPLETGNNPKVEIYTKVATGSEPPNYTYDTGSGTASHNQHVALLGRVAGVDTPNDAESGYQTSGSTADAPSVTMSSPGLLICACVPYVSNAVTAAPAGMTEILNASSGSFTFLSVAVQTVSGGATGARTFTLAGSTEAATVSLGLE